MLMADTVTPEVRSRMMSGIRSKDTRQEVVIRKALHTAGFRYRLHRRDLPGTPDITLPRYCAVIFVHGCFWHGHDCPLFRLPSTNSARWATKIAGNQHRDMDAVHRLLATGWRVCTIWECAGRGALRKTLEQIIEEVSKWLVSNVAYLDIQANTTRARAYSPTGPLNARPWTVTGTPNA